MLSEEVTKMIGKKGPITAYEVDRGNLRRYAAAVEDDTPIYWDDELARSSRYGTIPSPPGFFGWPVTWKINSIGPGSLPRSDYELGDALTRCGYKFSVDGGIEIEFLRPVKAGDLIYAQDELVSVTEREGKTGSLGFTLIGTTFINQNGEVVAKVKSTAIFLPSDDGGKK